MKKLLLILLTLFSFAGTIHAQQDNDGAGDENIRDKMSQYIQERLQVTRPEAERFAPIFIRYFKEWRMALRLYKGDPLVRQQRIIELRLRYRDEFRGVLGDKRCNQVFKHQDIFIQEIKILNAERRGNNRPFMRRRF